MMQTLYQQQIKPLYNHSEQKIAAFKWALDAVTVKSQDAASEKELYADIVQPVNAVTKQSLNAVTD